MSRYNLRPRKLSNIRKRPGSYQILKNDIHKRKVNHQLARFMASITTNIVILDNVEMLSSKSLQKYGILPKQLTVVEYNKKIFTRMFLKDVNIVRGAIEEYIDNAEYQSIGGVYFDFTGNHRSIRMFDKGIHALANHDTPEQLRIALTFSEGRGGKFSEPELHDKCLDLMESAFANSVVERTWYYPYRRPRGMQMHHYQFIIHKSG